MDRLNYFVKACVAYFSMIMLWCFFNHALNNTADFTDIQVIAIALSIIAQGIMGSRYAYKACAFNDFDYDLKDIESPYPE